jgi:ammonium transporter
VPTEQALDIAWILIAAALVMFMQAGFSSLESGMVRSKNSINVAGKTFADFCLTTGVFWVFGFAVMFGASVAGLFGSSGFLFSDRAPFLMAFFFFQIGFAGTSTTIMSGAVAERMRFSSYLIAALVFSAAIYPVFGHWAWGSLAGGDPGWLEELGFIDFAGSTVVHSVGGWMALAMVLILGPRIGRFGKDAVQIHGHDLPLVTLGVFILWFGWIGFNGGSTLGLTPDVPAIIVNTVLAGAFGGLAALGLTWWRDQRVDVPTIMNGSLAGLVGITASANIVSTMGAVAIGAIAGVVMYGVTLLLARLEVDDVVGAVPVHLAAGIWGTLAVAVFGATEAWGGGSRLSQLWIQGVGIFFAFIWAFGIGYIIMWLINRRFPLRIDPEGELIGLNVAEHGASTEILDLLTDMDAQRASNDFSEPVRVEPHTEIGQIAGQYNRVIHDINQQTAALRLMQRTATAANEAETIEEALKISLEEVSAAIGWPLGHVYLVDEDDSNLLVPTDIWQSEDPERYAAFLRETSTTTFRAGDGLPGQVLARRQPAWLAVFADARDPRTQAARKAGLRAGVAFPVMAGTEVAAVLELFSDLDQEPDSDWLNVMASVGTQLGRAVERLRSEQQRFQTVVDNMPAMVMLRDLEGRFILINRQYEEVYGVSNDDVRGRTFLEVDAMSPIDMLAEETVAHDQQVIENNQTIEQELAIRIGSKDHVFAAVKFPINDHAGKIVAVGGVELDITDLKQHEAELAELVRTVEMARDQAMTATAAKSQFLASASHELRTPLNAIMGFTRLVQRHTAGALDDRDTENIDKILVSAENLLALINDLLDLSRIEAGRQDVDPSEFDVEPLVAECLDTVEPLVGTNVELVMQVGGGLSMYTDHDKVRQILINLLSNAVKFTDNGNVTTAVELRGNDVVFEVIDTGIGIPQEALERVFDEFQQQPTAGRDVQRGTGLGLTISRQLARLLGGDVTVASVVGGGSTFTISLPARYEPPQVSAA